MQFRVWSLTAALALAAGSAHANQTFKDWWAACDNTRDCAAFGFSDQEREETAFLKLTRGPGAADQVHARIAVDAPPGAWSLSVDGKPVAAPRRAEEAAESYTVLDLTPADGSALVAAAANGSWLEVSAGGKTIARISLAGSSAALRWIDDQQQRAGGVTALVARGTRPASAVPPAPLPPLVGAASAAPQQGLPDKPPRAVAALMKDCDEDIAALGEAPVVGRLAPGLVMWAPLCSRGAYNLVYSFTLLDEKTGAARPLPIAYAGGRESTTELMNVSYDADTQTLSNFEKGRGLADCGAGNVWVWDGKSFAAVEQSLMGECRGVPPSEWPTVWRTRQP